MFEPPPAFLGVPREKNRVCDPNQRGSASSGMPGMITLQVVGMPSLSKAMQKANGKLFPLGFLYIMSALRKPKVIDMLLTGVAQEHQSSGVAVVLIAELQNEMIKAGIDTLETTGIFETNQSAITNWKNYDHIQHKRRRCFRKGL